MPFSDNCAAGVADVGEHHRGAQKNVIPAGNALVNAHIVLYFDIAPQHDAGGDKYVLAQVAAFPQHGSAHHVAEMPDPAAVADLRPFVNNGGGVGKEFLAHH